MKKNALSYMIKYLPCLLVNFQATIYKNLLLAKCSKLTTRYIIKVRTACSSPENTLDHNNHTFVKSFRRIINFYSHQVNQCLLANILNRLQSGKCFNYICSAL